MHEWALAESVKESVLNLYKEYGAIKKVQVSIGELQQIDLEIFKYALNELVKGTAIENVDFEIVVKPARMRCNVCGHEWSFKDALKSLGEDACEAIHFIPELAHSFIRCPKCNSPDFEVLGGRGVWIEYVEVKK